MYMKLYHPIRGTTDKCLFPLPECIFSAFTCTCYLEFIYHIVGSSKTIVHLWNVIDRVEQVLGWKTIHIIQGLAEGLKPSSFRRISFFWIGRKSVVSFLSLMICCVQCGR